MHRIGCSPSEALDLAPAIKKHRELHLQGLLTHFAVADEPDNPYTARQVADLRGGPQGAGPDGDPAAAGPRRQLGRGADRAPTPATTWSAAASRSTGSLPAPSWTGGSPLKPALSLKARVSYVRRLAAGERLSYGLRYELDVPSTVVTVPVGYADGVPRRLGQVGGEVLIGGRRKPIAGAVTMDQLLVDLGPGADADEVEVGTEVVLLGRQGDDRDLRPGVGRASSRRSPTRSAAASGSGFPAATSAEPPVHALN